MGIVIQKFGGSSLATTEKLEIVAQKIIQEKNKGNQVVVVVSAQGKTTDRLIQEEKEITDSPSRREHDVLVSTGEQVTIAKIAMFLNKKNCKAISLTGWQVPIITNSVFGNGRIRYINNEIILNLLNSDNVVIVAGFQGIDENYNITTLGRGGSDTTAVSLAASLNAEKCDIYTDVDGVFSADPRIVEEVKKLDKVSYDEMLEMASSGAKVLHNRCVEIGKKYNVPIYVKSTFEKDSVGTLIEKEGSIENLAVTGVAKDDNIAKITIKSKEESLLKAAKMFKLLANDDISIDIIMQDSLKDLAFIIKIDYLKNALKILNENKDDLNIDEISYFEDLSKVSMIGLGIANKPGIAAELFETLANENINIKLITSSEIRVSILVDQNNASKAVQALHKKFINEKIKKL